MTTEKLAAVHSRIEVEALKLRARLQRVTLDDVNVQTFTREPEQFRMAVETELNPVYACEPICDDAIWDAIDELLFDN